MHFLESLQKIIVLNGDIVKNIRKNIFIENPTSDKKSQSIKLINEIQLTVNKNLLGIEPDFIPIVKEKIYKNSIKNNCIFITSKDIFFEILNIDLNEENLSHILSSWYYEQNLEKHFSLSEANNYLKEHCDKLKSNKLKNQQIEKQILTIDNNPKIVFNKKQFLLIPLFTIIVFSLFILNHSFPKTTNINNYQVVHNEISFKKISNIINTQTKENIIIKNIVNKELDYEKPGIPNFLKYKDVNAKNLRDYLNNKNSALSDDPYFSTIIKTAKKYDVNPLLLFAITGQEQGFVRRDNPNMEKIINNPFNVYMSWENYNTDIMDSSKIAAITIVKILRKRKSGEDPFVTINNRYAADKNWAFSVEIIFNNLENTKDFY